jgi:hypothetical protein
MTVIDVDEILASERGTNTFGIDSSFFDFYLESRAIKPPEYHIAISVEGIDGLFCVPLLEQSFISVDIVFRPE